MKYEYLRKARKRSEYLPSETRINRKRNKSNNQNFEQMYTLTPLPKPSGGAPDVETENLEKIKLKNQEKRETMLIIPLKIKTW